MTTNDIQAIRNRVKSWQTGGAYGDNFPDVRKVIGDVVTLMAEIDRLTSERDGLRSELARLNQGYQPEPPKRELSRAEIDMLNMISRMEAENKPLRNGEFSEVNWPHINALLVQRYIRAEMEDGFTTYFMTDAGREKWSALRTPAPAPSDTTDWCAFPLTEQADVDYTAMIDSGYAGKVHRHGSVRAWHFADGISEYEPPVAPAAAAKAAPKLTKAQGTLRKPHNGNAGYVAELKNRRTGIGYVVIYRAKDADIDTDQPWAVVCETHGTTVGCRSMAMARQVMKAVDFCEACIESTEGGSS